MNATKTLSFFLLLSLLSTSVFSQRIIPCLEGEPGCDDDVSISLRGPSNVYDNDEDYYNVFVSGATHYSTSYDVYGGTTLSNNKSQIHVKWTSPGTNRYVRATVNTSSGLYIRYVYVTVSSCNLNAGSIGNAQTVCYNGNPSTITNTSSASGGNGSYDYQWQIRDPGSSWKNIPGVTGSTYNPPNLTSTKDYRRRVQSCSQTKYTNHVRITVRPSLTSGSIGNAQTVCYNGNPSTITNTSSPSGGNGSYSYQWQIRNPGSSWSNISGATGSTYNPPVLTATKDYRRRVQSCGETKYTGYVRITVRPSLTAGSIGNAQTVCYNGDPSTITNTSTPSGGDGSYSYQWQVRDLGGSWSDISGATGSTYNPPSLTSTKEYRRGVLNCNDTKYTDNVRITVLPSLDAGMISNEQTVCYGGDPNVITNATLPTGGDGSYSYQWQSRPEGGSWSNITGATSSSYDPLTLTATTEYRRSVASCGQTQYSNVIIVQVNPSLSPGSIGSSQELCEWGTPEMLENVSGATGGDGNYTYQWEKSVEGGSWEVIANADLASYQPDSIGLPTDFRRMVSSCGETSYSNIISITRANPTTPTIASVSSNDCGPKTITRDAPPVGERWFWQESKFGMDSTNSNLTYEASVSDTYYLRSRTDGGCWGPVDSVTVVVKSIPSAPVIAQSSNTLDGPELIHMGAPAGESWYWQTSRDGESTVEQDSIFETGGPGTYYLRSLGDNGCWSEPDSVTLVASEPANIITSDIQPDQVTFSWSGAGNETGYRISRSLIDSTGYQIIYEGDEQTTSFTDTRLANEETYYYKIQAIVNDEYSGAPTTTAVTTPAIPVDNSSFIQTPFFNGTISAVRWKSHFDTQERVYAFGYDQLNRLERAHYGEMETADAVTNKGVHALSGITYDLNGNIQSLNRQGLNGSSEFRVIDELTYDYDDGAGDGNMLYEVYDKANDEGFKDGTNAGPDYGYDANGNLLFDKNKGIKEIYYNHLDLPYAIVLESPIEGGEGSVTDSLAYLYDATGAKLQQKFYRADTLYKTYDYLGASVYETIGDGERKLVQIKHEQGRIVPLEGEAGGEYDYQYHLTDHLGNIRVTFSTTLEQYVMVENYEGGEENGFVDLKIQTDQNANTTLPLASNNKVSKLASGETSSLIFLHMNKGDTVDLFVNANYDEEPSGNNFASTAYGALFGTYNGSIAGGEASSAIENEFNDALSGAGMLGKGATSDAPRAFLNYIIFDEEMNYVTAGFEQISTNAYRTAPNEFETISLEDIIAEQNGYILAYLSNENDEAVNVFFDDFTVVQSKTNVVYTSDYYPYGMAFNEVSRTGREYNRWKYQGKEYLDEEGLDVYDFHARYYDPALGRFTTVDPQNQFMSGYVGMGNMPIMMVDPDGEIAFLAVAAFVAKAAATSAAISGAFYTANVAMSDGGFENWDWGQFGTAVGKGAVRGAVTAGLGEFSQIAGVKMFGEMKGIGGGLTKLGYQAFSTTAVSAAGNLAIGDDWNSSLDIGVGPLTLPFRNGKLSTNPLDHLNNIAFMYDFGKASYEVLQGDMKLGFDIDNMNPYFERKSWQDRRSLKKGGRKKIRKTMFDKYYTPGTTGFTTQSGVAFLRENLGENGIKARHGKFAHAGEWATTRFHEGVHVQQARFSGNLFTRALFGKGLFKYYNWEYAKYPWEYGKYGAYTIADRWISK